MKKSELLYSVVFLPIDYFMLLLAAIYAYSSRYTKWFVNIRPVIFDLDYDQFIDVSALVAVLWILIFALFGLYSTKRTHKFLTDFIKIVGGCTTGLAAVTFIIFFSRELFSSRFIVLAAWLLAIIFVSFGRVMVYLFRGYLLRKGIGCVRLAIIGDDKVYKSFCQAIEEKILVGYKIVMRFRTINDSNRQQLIDLKLNKKIDEILQIGADLDKVVTKSLLDISHEYHIPFKYAANLFDVKAHHVDVVNLAGIPFVEFKKTPLEGWGQILKRIFDIVGSTLAILIFSPFMLLIAIIIKLTSRGPIIYRNKRINRDKEFYVYKFRTMKLEYCTGEGYDNNGQAAKFEEKLIKQKSTRVGPVYKVVDDPRRFKFGKWLEKTSMDELPQFFNVFLGRMSLVGPRPHQPREVAKYSKHHKSVLAIKPGLTGLAQISGRSDLDFEDEVKLDTYYIENWSILLDLAIIVKTPFIVLFSRHS